MRIVCPSCEAEYEVPESIVASGPRKVRCHKCAREWQVMPPPGMTVAPPPPPEPAAAPMPDTPRAPAPPPLAEFAPPLPDPRAAKPIKVKGGAPSLGLVFAWLFTLAILGGGVGVAWLKKTEIIAFWPPASRIYKLLDLN
jgi:predicted Zn finger-like uncharacterized protein